MSSTLLRKHVPAADGFFDLGPSEDDRRAQLAVARAAVTVGPDHFELQLQAMTDATADGVYALTRADARHVNAALDLPEQPNYDWSDFKDPDEDE